MRDDEELVVQVLVEGMELGESRGEWGEREEEEREGVPSASILSQHMTIAGLVGDHAGLNADILQCANTTLMHLAPCRSVLPSAWRADLLRGDAEFPRELKGSDASRTV
jgi:hypothetical protein